jgi:hypothetical protein
MTTLVDDLVPDELWALVKPLLPASPRPPYGGRRRVVPDRNCFAAIVFMARTSTPWRLLPAQELGCGSSNRGGWPAAAPLGGSAADACPRARPNLPCMASAPTAPPEGSAPLPTRAHPEATVVSTTHTSVATDPRSNTGRRRAARATAPAAHAASPPLPRTPPVTAAG